MNAGAAAAVAGTVLKAIAVPGYAERLRQRAYVATQSREVRRNILSMGVPPLFWNGTHAGPRDVTVRRVDAKATLLHLPLRRQGPSLPG